MQPCANIYRRGQLYEQGTFDILTELLMFLAAVHLIYSLQMRLLAKLLVILAFSARLPVIAIAGIRLYYLDLRLSGSNFTFDYVIATQWQMGYAIMSSTITGMGPFLKPFDKEYWEWEWGEVENGKCVDDAFEWDVTAIEEADDGSPSTLWPS
ncbi:hypothetical protein J4E86_007334 [Alternaria arbusti]|uniref:uncharacterized protein n=1 Tax=Alternaria arbusti TaxID=232088 RepID=UPI0022203A20|nr:uncharacterized protein J4E86_007334 [Alternaria arbusti]KAI4950827.1 hypothetical protein J4E86_007334 [Alternaria arbusti]